MGIQYRGIHGFDITTSCDLFFPERVFALVGELNSRRSDQRGEPLGVEVYPTRPTPWAHVDARHVRQWERRHGATVQRVHIEFVSDKAELDHVLRRADRRPLKTRAMLRAMYSILPDAASGSGMTLAADLGVCVNVHANVLAHWSRIGQLERLPKCVPEVLAENNLLGEYLYVNGPITYDPRVIAAELVGEGRVTGLLLAIDHLIEYYRTQRIDPFAILDDPEICRVTKAIHIAGPGHSAIKIADPWMERLLRKLARTTFAHPVRLVFDYGPTAFLCMPFRGRVRLFEDTIAWIRHLHERA
jgi:hypothetical protein